VLLGIIAAPDLVDLAWRELPAGVWLNIAFLAIGAAAVANLLYYRGVKTVGPARASLMMFNVPVINTLCATLLLGESFGRLQGAGALVLGLGAVLAVTQGRLPRRSAHAGTRPPVAGSASPDRRGDPHRSGLTDQSDTVLPPIVTTSVPVEENDQASAPL
jgi:hypothetical protein